MRLMHKFSLGNPSKDATLVEQITQHMQHILNTTEGFGSFVQRYGVAKNEGQLDCEPYQQGLEAQMIQVLTEFEPRMQVTSIKIDEHATFCDFYVEGLIHDLALGQTQEYVRGSTSEHAQGSISEHAQGLMPEHAKGYPVHFCFRSGERFEEGESDYARERFGEPL